MIHLRRTATPIVKHERMIRAETNAQSSRTERWFVDNNGELNNQSSGSKLASRMSPFRDSEMPVQSSCPAFRSDMIVKQGRFPPSPTPLASPGDPPENTVSLPGRGVWIAAVAVGVMALFSLIAVMASFRPQDRPEGVKPASTIAPLPPKTVFPDAATDRQMGLLGLLVPRRKWNSAEREAQIEIVPGYWRR